jgi:hypothetical protein
MVAWATVHAKDSLVGRTMAESLVDWAESLDDWAESSVD